MMSIDVEVNVFYGLEVKCDDYEKIYEGGPYGDEGEYQLRLLGGSALTKQGPRCFLYVESTLINAYDKYQNPDGSTCPINTIVPATKMKWDHQLVGIAIEEKLPQYGEPQWWVGTYIS